jgi:hypothetical protein
MKNYDLNIWDVLSYKTDGEYSGDWKINAYVIPEDGGGYGSGPILDEELTLSASNLLALGINSDSDDELWIDAHSFIDQYNVPRRVLRWLESLPQEGK